jgi:membrane protein implicated in regulation of membrane protease activity
MDTWVVWVIVAAVLGVGEILTTSLYLAPFAISAAVAAGLSALGAGVVLPLLAFAVLGSVLLVTLRPIARAHLRTPPQIRTGTAKLVGRPGLVLEPLVGPDHCGRVKIDGEVWSAQAYDQEDIAAGAHVHVIEIKGATALVSE